MAPPRKHDSDGHPRRGAHARSARRPARRIGRGNRTRERRAGRHALPPLRQPRRRAGGRLAAGAGTLSAARADRRRRSRSAGCRGRDGRLAGRLRSRAARRRTAAARRCAATTCSTQNPHRSCVRAWRRSTRRCSPGCGELTQALRASTGAPRARCRHTRRRRTCAVTTRDGKPPLLATRRRRRRGAPAP